MNKVGIETDRITEPENTIVKIDDVDYKDIIGHMRGDQDFNGPLTTRKCTNTFFLIFFILCNCGLIACTVYIFLKGNPKSLTKGYDLRGNVCGLNELSSKRFMLFPNQTTLDWSLCVEACPYYYYKNYYCLYDGNNTEKYYPEWGCWDAYSTTAIGFYCVPTSKEPRKEVLSFLAESMQVLKQSSGDLLLVWDLILIGSIFSTLTGFFLLFLFRKAKVIKWIVIGSIGFLAVVMAFFVFLLVYASQRSFDLICGNYGPAMPEYCDHSSEYFYIGISYAVGVLGAIYIYKVIGKYKDFGIGIEMIELTCKPLHVIRELLLFPFIQIFIGTAVLLLLLMLVLWTMSSASVQEIQSENIPGGKAYIIAFTVLEKYILIFNTLMALWWINFVVDLGDFVLAGGVATWYFSRQKDVLYGPLLKGFKRCLRYHIGSIAYGSLIRPFAMFLASILAPFSKIASKVKSTSPCHKRFIAKTCFCTKWYFSKLRYITKQNYIFLSIFGENFFDSGIQALHLLRRNYVRIGRPGKIGDFVLSIIQFVIILAGPCLTFSLVLFANRTTTGQLTIELSSAISPVLFTFIISWFIGRVFAGALRVSLNTVLISAACDEEMFSGEQRFIEPELLSFMDGMGEEQNQQHQENKLKVRIEVGYNKNSSSVLYTRSDSAKPYFNKVLPSNNQWEDSERSHSNSRLYTPSLNVYPPSPSENHSFLEDINEASLEEEVPQYNIGYAAKYVED